MVGIGVVVSLREPVDEDSRVGSFQLDGRVGAVVMVDWQERVSHGRLIVEIISGAAALTKVATLL